MNKEIQSIIRNLQITLEGEPWYGRSVYSILSEIDEEIAQKKPNQGSHSLIELLYHMITWAEFTVKRLENDHQLDLKAFEAMDWRKINSDIHTWSSGVQQLKSAHEQIIHLLEDREDDFLKEIVDYRKYNFRFLLNGLIQHDVYHLGQIAYLYKLLK